MKFGRAKWAKKTKVVGTCRSLCMLLLLFLVCCTIAATSGKNEHRHKLFVTRAKGHDIDVITE